MKAGAPIRSDRPGPRRRFGATIGAAGAIVLGLGGCEQARKPPPATFFAGLPVSGSLADAHRAGFTDCFYLDAVHLRCRRHAVTFRGAGSFEAAVDFVGSYGNGGFDEVTLWHDRDNYAVYQIADAFERAGWKHCYTGDDQWGDQIIYRRAGSPVLVSMDVSYYAKRRLRLIPVWNRRERRCLPA